MLAPVPTLGQGPSHLVTGGPLGAMKLGWGLGPSGLPCQEVNKKGQGAQGSIVIPWAPLGDNAWGARQEARAFGKELSWHPHCSQATGWGRAPIAVAWECQGLGPCCQERFPVAGGRGPAP